MNSIPLMSRCLALLGPCVKNIDIYKGQVYLEVNFGARAHGQHTPDICLVLLGPCVINTDIYTGTSFF